MNFMIATNKKSPIMGLCILNDEAIENVYEKFKLYIPE